MNQVYSKAEAGRWLGLVAKDPDKHRPAFAAWLDACGHARQAAGQRFLLKHGKRPFPQKGWFARAGLVSPAAPRPPESYQLPDVFFDRRLAARDPLLRAGWPDPGAEGHERRFLARCARVAFDGADEPVKLLSEDVVREEARTSDTAREAAAAGNRRMRAKWAAEGRCLKCGGERDDAGRTNCVTCRDALREWYKAKRAEAVKKGRCTRCFKDKPVRGRAACQACLDRRAAARAGGNVKS